MFSAAAVAQVNSDNVKAVAKTLLRDCQHVIRPGRTLDPVPDNNRGMIPAVSLPTAVSQNLYARFHFKETLLISFRIKTKAARPGVGGECLCVTVSKNPVRYEASP